MAKSPPATEDNKPELWERWDLGPWQFTQWRDYDSGEPETWYRFGPVRERVTALDDRYRSLGEAMLVAVASQYEVEQVEAQSTAFMCARLIGMHHFDGIEWAHRGPLVKYLDV
jgi:hypothetical protein